MATAQKPAKLSLRTRNETLSPAPRLRPFGDSRYTRDCSAIIVVVPGIGTDPIPSWKSASIIYSIQKIASELTSNTAYVCWWNHDLPVSHLFSFQHQHVSAVDLQLALKALLSEHADDLCPIYFVGHSIGGLIVKEALRSWDQTASNERRHCTAGAIFLATPHTWQLSRARTFCGRASLAFLKQKHFDSDYPPKMTNLCKTFETMNIPAFSVFEGVETKLRFPRSGLLVDRELALFGSDNEQLWAVPCAHKELCHCTSTEPMYNALAEFLERTLQGTMDKLSRRPKKSSYSIKTRSSLRSPRSYNDTVFSGSIVESPLRVHPISPPSPVLDGNPLGFSPSSASPTSGVLHNIPEENELFFPRDDVLQPVEDVLLKADPWQDPTIYTDRIRAFALSGSGGMGKSACAGHFLHRHRYRYENVFWVNAESISKLFDAYSQIALKLRLVSPKMPHDRFDCQRLVTKWLMSSAFESRQHRVKWLLVFDNVERPEDLDGFWPSQGCGDILMTTQCSMTELNKFSAVYGTEVRPFGKDVALAFLSRLTAEEIQDPVQLARATQIAQILGGSPLALLSLSCLIKQNRLDQDLIRRVTHETKRRESSGSDSSLSSNSRPDLSGESMNQLSIIVEPLLEKLTVAASLLDVMCLLDKNGVQEGLLIDATMLMQLASFPDSAAAYEKAKEELFDSVLVSSVLIGDKRGIAVPGMIRDIVRRRMSASRLQEVFQNTIQVLSDLWPEMALAKRHNARRFGKIDMLLRHVRSLQDVYDLPGSNEFELSFRANITFGKLLDNAAWCMYERGDYEDAKYFAEQARSIGEELDEDATPTGHFDVPDLLSEIYYTLGAIAQITHQKGDSLALHGKMLVLRKKLKSKSHDGDALLAHAYNEMGNDFMTDDEYDIALGFYNTSIKIYKNLGEKFEPSMLILPKVNLGLAYWLQNDHEKAYSIVHDALQEQEQELGPDDGITMKTGRLLFAMGNITYSLGRFDESLEYHSRAFKQFESTIGGRHNRTCDVMWRLADHYARMEEYEKAIKWLTDALENVWNRPLFEREKARLCFKIYTVMKCTKEYPTSSYQQYLDFASEVYCKHRPQKPRKHLDENDFNDLVMFWSR